MTPEQTKPIYEQIKKDISKYFNQEPTDGNKLSVYVPIKYHSRRFSINVNTRTINIIIEHCGYEITCQIHGASYYNSDPKHPLAITQPLTQEGSYTTIIEYIKASILKLT